MKLIYLYIRDGIVCGWGSFLENAPSVSIDENDPFFTDHFEVEYEFVDGELRIKE